MTKPRRGCFKSLSKTDLNTILDKFAFVGTHFACFECLDKVRRHNVVQEMSNIHTQANHTIHGIFSGQNVSFD